MSHVTTTRSNPVPIWLVLMLVFGFVVVAGIGFLYWQATITVVGSEFSPYSFSVRDFRYVQNWHNVPDTPWTVCDAEITKHLSNSTSAPGTDRWDAIRFNKGFQLDQSIGEAALLVDRIDKRNEKGEDWEEWSKTHAKRASVLWPAVQEFAIHRAYFAIPDLLDQAKVAGSDKEFDAQLKTIAVQAAVDQAYRLLGEEKFEEAWKVLKWGRKYGESSELEAIEDRLELKTSSDESKR